MKKVLYISSIEVPYRTEFFNGLSKNCDLTVLYERKKSSNRDAAWAKSEDATYAIEYLDGINIKNEHSISIRIFKYIFSAYDCIIVGCYNSPVQMMAILVMKLLRKPYILNTDGEQFVNLNTWKGRVKAFFLRGASKYLAAGEKSADSLHKVVGDKEIIPYYFSSLSQKEIEEHAKLGMSTEREEYVLVIGQYFDYKGLDVVVKTASMDTSIKYKFVGMGNRTELFKQETGAGKLPNVEIIPFLQKKDLEQEYLKCAAMVLPSRQECWGLVVNEAASFGTPVVSTSGSGAAVEFLADEYPQFISEVDDAEALLDRIKLCLFAGGLEKYSEFMIDKTRKYYIEKNVEIITSVLM